MLPDSKTRAQRLDVLELGDHRRLRELHRARRGRLHRRALPHASPTATSRGLVGHSMGGYGATRIGMKHADVFGSLYIMSPCCLSPRGSARSGAPGTRRTTKALAGGQDAGGLGQAAVRPARAARLRGRVVAQPEESAALSRSADRDGAPQPDVLASGRPTRRWPSSTSTSATCASTAPSPSTSATRTGCASTPASCTTSSTATASPTASRSTPARTPAPWPIRFQNHVMPFFSRTLCADKTCK